MKIIGFKVRPIAFVFAVIYAALGVFFWITYCVSTVDYITLPVGFIAPLSNLNFNFHLHRSSSIPYNLLLLLGSILSYGFSGWITSAIAVICFNAIAKTKGGISADFVRLREKQSASRLLRSRSLWVNPLSGNACYQHLSGRRLFCGVNCGRET